MPMTIYEAPPCRNDHVQAGIVETIDQLELSEWFDSLFDVLHRYGPEKTQQLLVQLREQAYRHGVMMPFVATTPYINTIPFSEQPRYPGNLDIEQRITSIIRWNAMVMVARANKKTEEFGAVGGHIATYASSATLYEVGYNHFFHGRAEDHPGDMVYFQAHGAPGMYARAFLEGRINESHLENFRQEIPHGKGLSSYPHPWLMPDFWQFPVASMGLGPICSIYQARFLRYLEHRGLKDTSKSRVWTFLGDGEVDEPETLGAITLASRERLDNLIWVINCNLQRLDGPVRGNGKIIQELEGLFRGAGWNCIKVVWSGDWDPLLEQDFNGKLVQRMGEVVDGQFQKYGCASVDYVREHFFGADPELMELANQLSDEELWKLRRGGHDPEKVYAAYKAACKHVGSPTVILVKTIKGYGLGTAGDGRNVAHMTKKMNVEGLQHFRKWFRIPISDDDIQRMPFYKPAEGSEELEYLAARRKQLGGPIPCRQVTTERLETPSLNDKSFERQLRGTGEKGSASTTQAYGAMLMGLMRHKSIGSRIVPIIPDEARTFGMESFFSMFGIYSSKGQLYDPVDRVDGSLMYYKEAQDGQMLEEGINEAGAMGSFIAAGTAYANLDLNMIPFYTFYSMFGFQRIGDLVWAAADSRVKGFLVGGTSGRTTLNGEGLQHEDGHSHLIATTIPSLIAYDPAYAYELAVIIQNGLQRMYAESEEVFYYLSVYNENYPMPAMPQGDYIREGILRGMYHFRGTDSSAGQRHRPQLFGSGTILKEVLRAQQMLREKYHIGTDVWSVTSYSELCRDSMDATRWNRLHPGAPQRRSHLMQQVEGLTGPFISASDNVRLVADQIRQWIPGPYSILGTDGFGRSDTRTVLRRHFEIDAECMTYTALQMLSEQNAFDEDRLPEVLRELEIDPDKVNPRTA